MSTASTGWRPSWPTVRHLAAEFVLILAGVLTALFVDTWWKGRDDRALERSYLAQLLVDTRENERILERTIAAYSETQQRTGRLLQTYRALSPRPPRDSLAAWARVVVPTFDPITGTMRGLLETGQIRLVQNARIRQAIVMVDAEIASVEARVGRNDLRQGELVELRTQRMIAHLPIAGIPTRVASSDDIGNGWWPAIDFDALLADRLAHATFQTIYYVQGNSLTALKRLREPYAVLRQQLEKELVLD